MGFIETCIYTIARCDSSSVWWRVASVRLALSVDLCDYQLTVSAVLRYERATVNVP